MVLLATSACARAPSLDAFAESDRGSYVLRGQSTVRWTVFDRGVAWVENTTYALQTQLRMHADKRCELQVAGTRETHAAFMMDEAREPTESHHAVEDTWRCRITRDRGARFVLAVLDEEGERQRYRCQLRPHPNPDHPDPALVCMPAWAHDGMPWEDPLPAYLRLPLALASAPVDVELWGDQEHAIAIEDIELR